MTMDNGTPNDDLTELHELAPERVAASKTWIYYQLIGWRRTWKPEALDLLAMAIALEEMGAVLREDARGQSTPHPPTP
jgi:negative regulator of sigma E activity